MAVPVGVALLVLVTVALSAAVGAATLSATEATRSGDRTQGTVGSAPPSGPTAAVVDLVVTDGAITLTHRGGDTLDVRRLRVVIRVGGERLHHQPPIPFFAARGFESGPTGPFNHASDHAWSAGESTTVTPAGTNRPAIRPGVSVEVSLFVDSQRLTVTTAVAG
ncbi:type IV pilin [Halobaculum sp. WSA2]|uniref:Type IV pilin n=1 Tax=Halobaculum saliterrae TaxID=2073113 RepID=A0A6B0SQB6_9EURY|nr:type IV pilin [Halobaculum saliterrae]